MKHHLIAVALIRKGDLILLVEQQGATDPEPSWSLPGGVVEEGELLHEALAREVQEETGLKVLAMGRLVYIMQRHDRSSDSQTLAFVFEVDQWRGDLRVDDPDNLILKTDFLSVDEATKKLQTLPGRYMRDPLIAYLHNEMPLGSVWIYRDEEVVAKF